MAELHEVFGIATQVRPLSYVDRGGLDERLNYLLKTDRHISIHGDTKQGKSWLRRRVLSENETLAVQCGLDATFSSILRDAFGLLGIQAPGRSSEEAERGGSLSVSGGGGFRVPWVASAEARAEAEGTASSGQSYEFEPIGQSLEELAWVARELRDSGKRLVIEDFHYVSEQNRRDIAYRLKALLDYEVPVVIVGIWPQDADMLVYYDGDLDGRVDSVYLAWTDAELMSVLERGADALNIRFDDETARHLINDAVGNVGLLQRLAEQLCTVERVMRTVSGDRQVVGTPESVGEARTRVSTSMRGRFGAFADNFVMGMRHLASGLEVYRHLLKAFTAASDSELITGIDSAELLARINAESKREVRLSDLTQALDRVGRLQSKIGVNPPVLAYSPDARVCSSSIARFSSIVATERLSGHGIATGSICPRSDSKRRSTLTIERLPQWREARGELTR